MAQRGAGCLSPVADDAGRLLAGVFAICVSSTGQCCSVSSTHFLTGFCLFTVEGRVLSVYAI